MTAPDIAISRAQIADAPEILALQKLAYRSEAEIYNDFRLPPLVQTLEELEAEMDQAMCLKAVRDEKIIGSVRAREMDGTCHVGRLIVHPSAQRQGLGQKLMAAIEAEFPQVKRYELFTGSRSEANLSFYAKLGYKQFAIKALSPRVTLVFMQKTGPKTAAA
jgi:ribosomal protein S18 acetylase RimI-like enzyme